MKAAGSWITNLFFFVGVMAFASAAQGAAEMVIPGTYVTEGRSHYESGAVNLREHGYGYVMTANLVRGDHRFATEAYLEPVGAHTLRGNGFITVRYSETSGCRHRFGVRIEVKDGELWLYENTPRYIPYNPNGACTAAGPYEWFYHPESYKLQE